jgi:hypothetical protein
VTHEAGRNLQEIVLETFTVLEREEKMEREKLAGLFLQPCIYYEVWTQ